MTTPSIQTPGYFQGSTQYTGLYEANHKNLTACLSAMKQTSNLELRVSRKHEFYTIEKIESITLKNLIRAICIFVTKLCKEGFISETTAYKNLADRLIPVLKDFPQYAMCLLQNDIVCGTDSLQVTLNELSQYRTVEKLSNRTGDPLYRAKNRLLSDIGKLKNVCETLSTDKPQTDNHKIFKPYDQKTVQTIIDNIYADRKPKTPERKDPKALRELNERDALVYKEACGNITSIEGLDAKFKADCKIITHTPDDVELSAQIQKALIIREAAEKLEHSRKSYELLENIDRFIGKIWDLYEPKTPIQRPSLLLTKQVTKLSSQTNERWNPFVRKQASSANWKGTIAEIPTNFRDTPGVVIVGNTFNPETYKSQWDLKSKTLAEQLAKELAYCQDAIDVAEQTSDLKALDTILQKLKKLEEICDTKKTSQFKHIKKDIQIMQTKIFEIHQKKQ